MKPHLLLNPIWGFGWKKSIGYGPTFNFGPFSLFFWDGVCADDPGQPYEGVDPETIGPKSTVILGWPL
jgi:hypothetical protein